MNKCNWKIYIISHSELYDEMYAHDKLFGADNYEVLNVGSKEYLYNTKGLRVIDQKKLKTYQNLVKWWAESERLYNLWLSDEWKSLDYIGFIHYDLELKLDARVKALNKYNITSRIDKYLQDKKIAHISFETHDARAIYNQKVMADVGQPNVLCGDGTNCYDYILEDYNKYFGTSYSVQDLLNRKQLNMCSCFLIDVHHFDEMMQWWAQIVKSGKLDIFDTEHVNRLQGGLAERYYSVYLAFAYNELLDLSLIHHFEDGIKQSKKHYCIIRRTDEYVGFFSFFNTTLGSIAHAKQMGYEVIVDDEGKHGWNSIFDQPNFSTVISAIQNDSSEIDYTVDSTIYDFRPDDFMEILTNRTLMKYWNRIYQDCCKISSEMVEFLVEIEKQLFVDGFNNTETIGVLCRGTDYLTRKPNNHPRQPKPEELFEEIDKLLASRDKEYKCVYLCTEDESIYKKFKDKYKDKLICNQTGFIRPDGDELLVETVQRENIDKIERNKSYFANIYFLSKCDALVAGRTSGTVGAMVMSNGYNDISLWNSGRYGDGLE